MEDQRLQELAEQLAQGMGRIDTLLSASDETGRRLAGLEERIDRLGAELVAERGRSRAGGDASQASASAEELAGLQWAVDSRLRELAALVEQGTARVGALLHANGETTGRLAALEQRLDRLFAQLALAQPAGPVPTAAAPAPSTGGNGAPLLDDLEVLLQGASDRLSALSKGRRDQRPGEEPERR